MPTSFPGALDAIARPAGTTLRNAPGLELSTRIDSLADAIEAVEAKLGTGVSPPPGAGVLRSTAVGATAYQQAQSADIGAGQVLTLHLEANAATQIEQLATQVAASVTAPASPVLIGGTVPMQLTLTKQQDASDVLVWFSGAFYTDAPGVGQSLALYLRVDAAGFQPYGRFSLTSSLDMKNVAFGPVRFTGLGAGARVIQVGWYIATGTLICDTQGIRLLTALEVKR